jgi:hypothetical protein
MSAYKCDDFVDQQLIITDDHASSPKNKDESSQNLGVLKPSSQKASKIVFQSHFENYLDLEKYGQFHRRHPDITLSIPDNRLGS